MMIGLDTNVLVRYIVQDNAAQARKATQLLESTCTRETPGRIDAIVLCELVWVLESAYGYEPPVVAKVMRLLLSVAELWIAESDNAWAALRLYENHTGGFADYLIGIRNRSAQASPTVTFDKKAAASAPDLFALVR